MLTTNDKLQIFEDFRIDYNLPKHYVDRQDQNSAISFMHARGNPMVLSNSIGEIRWGEGNPTWFSRLWNKIENSRWYKSLETSLEWKNSIPIAEFFRSVFNSAEELNVVDSRMAGYEKALAQARDSGQTALVEKLKASIVAVRSEAQLVAIGLSKYLEEDSLVQFVKKAKKGLRLDYVANFVRFIPKDIVDQKRRADELKIFDNYVVLHYDPEAKSWAETEAEKAARKDPILFGLISGRRRLYFVGDWVDEQCDLTLDQIADSLGEGSVGNLEITDNIETVG